MATDLTTDIGEEYLVDQQPDGDTITYLLFDDSLDGITETDDLSAINNEADSTNDYARQSDTVSTAQLSGSGNGDYGYDNDNQVQFNVDSNTDTVDSVGYIANFTSSVAGDGSATDHLVAVDSFDAGSTDLTNISTVTYSAGDLEHKVSNS